MAAISSPVVRAFAATLVFAGALFLNAHDSAAAVPDPSHCTVPECLTICPAGDRTFSIVVRDVNNSPIPGSTVHVRLLPASCQNPTIVFCEDCPEAANYDPGTQTLTRITDLNGIARFQLCGSIFCQSPQWVEVRADGIVLDYTTFATTDLDGDLDVDAVDVFLSNDAEGHNRPQADQDCSHNVNHDDTTILEAHVGHVCPGVVPTLRSSWGEVKSTYR